MQTTTILGTTYAGSPMCGSLALSLHQLECAGKAEEAAKRLAAYNHVRACFGAAPLDLSEDMTTAPQEGLIIWPAGKGTRDAEVH